MACLNTAIFKQNILQVTQLTCGTIFNNQRTLQIYEGAYRSRCFFLHRDTGEKFRKTRLRFDWVTATSVVASCFFSEAVCIRSVPGCGMNAPASGSATSFGSRSAGGGGQVDDCRMHNTRRLFWMITSSALPSTDSARTTTQAYCTQAAEEGNFSPSSVLILSHKMESSVKFCYDK